MASALSPEHWRALEIVERNARALLRRVDDLLDIAKLDAGKTVLSYANVDLSRLVRRVIGNFETLAVDRQIDLVTELAASVPAQVDREKVERVLLNVLSNAFKFTPPGGTVRCRLAVLEDRTDTHPGLTPGLATIAVYDSGPGVPAELREAVFERFRQVEGGPTRRFGGTGLGLAIVKEIVELHGGSVAISFWPRCVSDQRLPRFRSSC